MTAAEQLTDEQTRALAALGRARHDEPPFCLDPHTRGQEDARQWLADVLRITLADRLHTWADNPYRTHDDEGRGYADIRDQAQRVLQGDQDTIRELLDDEPADAVALEPVAHTTYAPAVPDGLVLDITVERPAPTTLAAVRARCLAATPDPELVTVRRRDDKRPPLYGLAVGDDWIAEIIQSQPDAVLFAHARRDLLLLLAAVDDLIAARDEEAPGTTPYARSEDYRLHDANGQIVTNLPTLEAAITEMRRYRQHNPKTTPMWISVIRRAATAVVTEEQADANEAAVRPPDARTPVLGTPGSRETPKDDHAGAQTITPAKDTDHA